MSALEDPPATPGARVALHRSLLLSAVPQVREDREAHSLAAAQGRLDRAVVRFAGTAVQTPDRWLRAELAALADVLRAAQAATAPPPVLPIGAALGRHNAAASPVSAQAIAHAATLATHAAEAALMAKSVARRGVGPTRDALGVHRCLQTVRALVQAVTELTTAQE